MVLIFMLKLIQYKLFISFKIDSIAMNKFLKISNKNETTKNIKII